jgi:hypothetical protein
MPTMNRDEVFRRYLVDEMSKFRNPDRRLKDFVGSLTPDTANRLCQNSGGLA